MTRALTILITLAIIAYYCREVARDALAEVGGMRHLCHQKNFTIMNG